MKCVKRIIGIFLSVALMMSFLSVFACAEDKIDIKNISALDGYYLTDEITVNKSETVAAAVFENEETAVIAYTSNGYTWSIINPEKYIPSYYDDCNYTLTLCRVGDVFAFSILFSGTDDDGVFRMDSKIYYTKDFKNPAAFSFSSYIPKNTEYTAASVDSYGEVFTVELLNYKDYLACLEDEYTSVVLLTVDFTNVYTSFDPSVYTVVKLGDEYAANPVGNSFRTSKDLKTWTSHSFPSGGSCEIWDIYSVGKMLVFEGYNFTQYEEDGVKLEYYDLKKILVTSDLASFKEVYTAEKGKNLYYSDYTAMKSDPYTLLVMEDIYDSAATPDGFEPDRLRWVSVNSKTGEKKTVFERAYGNDSLDLFSSSYCVNDSGTALVISTVFNDGGINMYKYSEGKKEFEYVKADYDGIDSMYYDFNIFGKGDLVTYFDVFGMLRTVNLLNPQNSSTKNYAEFLNANCKGRIFALGGKLIIFKEEYGSKTTHCAAVENMPSVSADNEIGDINGDGKINSSDALLVLQCSVGITNLTEKQKTSADINSDGKINSSDALKILQYAVGIIKKF